MDKLLLHPATENQLKALITAKPHSVLICGNAGSGKKTIVAHIVEQVLGHRENKSNSSYLSIQPENGSIGIDSIRNIRDFIKRKTVGDSQIRRIITIINAHALTNEAQNALLKTLEEPPADTMLILTIDNLTSLKQTIQSRSQKLLVSPISESTSMKYFKNLSYTDADIQSSYYISDGRVGLMSSLLTNSSDHELVKAIKDAKAILGMPLYDRMLLIESLSKQKNQIALLLFGFERVIISGLRLAAIKNNVQNTIQFHKISQKISEAQNMLKNNGNNKLILTDLFLNV